MYLHPYLLDEVGEACERIVEAPHDGDARPHVVPQREEVDDPGQQHPAEDHPECEARHVPCTHNIDLTSEQIILLVTPPEL